MVRTREHKILSHKVIVVGMNENVCANCSHFIQHYHKHDDYYFSAVNGGHCTSGRIKKRSPCDEACVKFENSYKEVKEV